jgi:Ser/Thr protein kinase RdoA (MazF antagonist)
MEGGMDPVWQVAEQFTLEGTVVDVREYGNGNINDTYLVTVSCKDDWHIVDEDRFILQRINTHVFTNPNLIVRNLRTFTEHAVNRLKTMEAEVPFRWEVPHICVTRSGEDYHIDPKGSFWRAISYVNHSHSYDTALNTRHAREVGYALGRFQSLTSDLNTERMYDTLVGYHITPQYLGKYDEIMTRNPQVVDSPKAQYCHQMIVAHRSWASVLEDAKGNGELQMRIIHGDPKINNIMICDLTGQAVSVIDLDTVKPGLVQYDIGDCLRSSCNPLGEETTDFNNIRFDIHLARSILEGYFSIADGFLTENDYAYMYDAICLIPFELGLRFFTDYLAGNVYFKVKHDRHNLERALVQFKLMESIETQGTDIRTIITDLKGNTANVTHDQEQK